MRNLLYTPWIILLLVGFAISGCSTVGEVSIQQRTNQICTVYGGTMNALAGLREAGKLSDEQIATVNEYRSFPHAVCSTGGIVPENAGALDALDAALFELMKIEGEAK